MKGVSSRQAIRRKSCATKACARCTSENISGCDDEGQHLAFSLSRRPAAGRRRSHARAMKPGLSLRLSQHLTLTPQLQQSIRLLQMSTIELEQEVDRYLQENPFLERVEDDAPQLPPTALAPTTVTTAPAATSTDARQNEQSSDDGGGSASDDRGFDDGDYVRDSWSDVDGASRNGGGSDDD